MDINSITNPEPYYQDIWLFISFSILFFLSFFILRKYIGFNFAFLVSLIKSIIPLIYFAFYLDGSWINRGDDSMYISAGILLYDLISSLFNFELSYLSKDFLYDPAYEFVNTLKVNFSDLNLYQRFILLRDNFSNNPFFFKLIHWVSFFSFVLFGYNWYSIVISNILINIIASIYLFKLSQKLISNSKYSKWLMIYFLLSVEVLSWTSFISLKESLALLINIMLFYYFYNLIKNMNFNNLIILIVILIAMYSVRYYLPTIYSIYFILAILMFYFNLSFFKKNLKYFILSSIPCLILLYYFSPGYNIGVYNFLGYKFIVYLPFYNLINFDFDLINFIKSIYSFYIGPKPWGIDLKYNFLFFSSVIHFIFIPFSIFGGYLLIKQNIYFSVMIIFLILIGIMYAIVGLENRHRFQFSFIYLWAQFHAISYFIKKR